VGNKIVSFLFILFFLAPNYKIQAQTVKAKPLTEILNTLQKKYHCRFTYADAMVKPFYIYNFKPDLSLKKAIKFLEKQTGLVFIFLDNTYITIKNKSSAFVICGYIIDDDTRLPVAAASLKSSKNYAISDEKGYFTLKVAYLHDTVWVSRLGYRHRFFLPQKSNFRHCQNILLQPKAEVLSTVVLQNLLAKGIHTEQDGITKINVQKFGILPGLIEPDILQTIQALPGIQSVNETVSHLNIRGGTNDQNLLLWDGLRLYQSGHFFGLISVLNPMITKDVLLIKNGSDVAYDHAVSGTIRMQSDTAVNKQLKAAMGVNFINADVFVDAPLGQKSSLQAGIRKAISNWFDTPTYKQYYDRVLQNTEVTNHPSQILYSNSQFDFYDISLRWLYRPSEKDLLRLNFINISDQFSFKKLAVIAHHDVSKQNGLVQNNMAEALYYQRKWSPDFTSVLQLYETDYKLKAVNTDLIQQQELQQENKVSETSVKLQTFLQIQSNLSWKNGYQFLENGTGNLTQIDQPYLLHYIREVIREHSLFSQVNFTGKNSIIRIKSGIRANYIEKFKRFLIEPRLAFNYQLNKSLSLNILGEFKHQNISQIINFQNDFLGIEKRRWRLSNEADVPIIQSKNLSAGINYSKNGWLVNAEFYIKNVIGITSQSQGFVNQYKYTKAVGSYQIKGLDLLVNKRWRRFSGWISYSYADNMYTFKDFNPVHFPNNLDIRHSITAGLSYNYRHFKTSIGLNWHSGKPTTLPVSGNEIVDNNINYDRPNATHLDDYFRMDWSAVYQFRIYRHMKANLGVSIWNLTNKQNILSRYYGLDAIQNLIEYQQKSLGLTPNLLLRVKF